MVQRGLYPLKAHLFLFQPQVLADTIVAQLVVQGLLRFCEVRQIVLDLGSFFTPQTLVSHERGPNSTLS